MSTLCIDIITIFPQMLSGFLEESMMKRSSDKGLVVFRAINPRDFTTDKHRSVDDRPYGGGPGMVMMAGPLFDAVESVRRDNSRVVLTTPQGRPFTQTVAEELSGDQHIILVCGHYEGIDERVRESIITDEISVGDYVLTNGTLPAATIIDAVVRLLPGVLGHEQGTEEESFQDGLLEYPQYTRPADFRGMKVPDILLSGDHGEIAKWRQSSRVDRTRERRPDLLDSESDSK